jgi:hypothetical protein
VDYAGLAPLLIPMLVPMLVAVVKYYVPLLPKLWLPVLTPVLGAALDIVNYYIGLDSWGPMWGAFLGALGVFVREVYDQVKKAGLA